MKKRLTKSEEKLRTRAKEWNVKENQDLSVELVENLCDTLKELGDRLYLTSNQIGYTERAFAIKFRDETEVFMNPMITKKDKMILFREKDPYTGVEYIIPRFAELEIAFQDCTGEYRFLKLNEASSIVYCQALDALDGFYPHDYGLEIIPEFDSATDEERAEVIEAYVNSMKDTLETLDIELTNDSETSNIWNAAKFIHKVNTGEVKLEEKPAEMSNRKKRKLRRLLKMMGKKVKEVKL